MIRRKGPILATAVIVAFALGWYRGFFELDPSATPEVSNADTQAETAATSGKVASPPVIAPEPSGELPKSDADAERTRNTLEQGAAQREKAPDAPPPAASTALGFDIVRVEPDGSAVIAGRGAPNQPIALTNGSRTLGETRTDANGDFVMSLSLPTGSHRLQLAQRDDVMSDDAVVVNVPARGRPDQLLVMIERPGEASTILQRPAEVAGGTAPATPEMTPEVKTPIEPQPGQQTAAVQTDPDTTTPDTQARLAAPAGESISVEAVEIEGGRMFVAGSAKAASVVRIYLDDRLAAETRSGAGDRFIASASVDVAVGDHLIRADVLDAAGRVVGRVEVPFQRPEGTSMAAVAPATATPPTEAAPARAQVAAMPERPTATVEGPDAVTQPPLQAAASRVIIRRGDTLWRISRTTYGQGRRYTVIYLANGDQIRDPNRIYPGQVFRMPSASEAGSEPRG